MIALILLLTIPLSLTALCDGFRLARGSPAIDSGELIAGFHCPAPGFNDSGCVEWFGKAPDLGACEYIPAKPAAPTNLRIE
jgi:hypothetical protein